MFRFRFVLAALLVSLCYASAARAASTRVYVASAGTDSGGCTRTAPCKTIPYAMGQVLARGEVVVLDSSSHSAFTIDKSVSVIAAPGAAVVIGATAAGLTAITVTVADTDAVVLRGLTLTGQNAGATGILFKGRGALHVESCVVSGFLSHGIYQRERGRLYVVDTVIRDGKDVGIWIAPLENGRVEITHCRIENILAGSTAGTGTGVFAESGASVSVSDSVVSGTAAFGFVASGNGVMSVSDSTAEYTGTGFAAYQNGQMVLTRVVAFRNSAGVQVNNNGAVIQVTGSTVTHNTTGLSNSGGILVSRGNNLVLSNTTANTSGAITYSTGSQ